MKIWQKWSLFMLLLFFLPQAAADEMIDNPAFQRWQKFKIGAMAKYLETKIWEETTIKSEISFILIESSPGKLVVEKELIEIDPAGKRSSSKTRLDYPARISATDFSVAKIPEAIETRSEAELELAGAKMKCEVIETRIRQGEAERIERKHYCEEVPGGLVKMESGMEAPQKKTHAKMILTEKRIP